MLPASGLNLAAGNSTKPPCPTVPSPAWPSTGASPDATGSLHGPSDRGVAGALLGRASVVGSWPQAITTTQPSRTASRARATTPRRSAADLGHALGGTDEPFLVDQVALLLAPDRALDDAG